MDEQKFHEFLNRFVGDLGATVAAGNVVLGDRLGLYRALAEGPQTADELAATHRHRRPVRRASGCAARPPAATSSTTRRPTPTR